MPPAESEADRAAYFDDSDFGEVATIRGKEIDGFFDEPTEFLDGLASVSVKTTNPTFQCQTVKLPADLSEREPITVTRLDGTVFSGKVVMVEPDGQGLSLLNLEDDD